MSERDSSGRPVNHAHDDRLESWKEIAAYLRRDIKTVQRWERREGLPVHRLVHDKLGSVYAFRRELDEWRTSRGPANGDDAEAMAGGVGGMPEADGAGSSSLDTGLISEPARPPAAAQAEVPGGRNQGWGALRRGVLGLATAIGLILLGVMLGRSWRPAAPKPPEVTRFAVEPPPGTRFAGTLADPDPVLSPDGRLILFRAADEQSGRQLLYLRRLSDPEARPLPGTESGIQAFFSPDGRRAGFFAGGFLKVIDLATGQVRALATAAHPAGGTWFDANEIVFAGDPAAGLARISAAGGTASPLTSLDSTDGETAHVYPQSLPGVRSVFFLAVHRDHERDVVQAVAADSGAVSVVVPMRRMPRFVPGDHMLYFRGRALVAQAFDRTQLRPAGVAEELAERLDVDDPEETSPGLSASASGTIAFWQAGAEPMARLTWFDRDGNEVGSVGPAGDYPALALSPDGSRVAVQRKIDAVTPPDIWTFDLKSGQATRMTAWPANDEDPVWFRDGQRILFARHRDVGGASEIRELLASRPLADRALREAGTRVHPTDWSADGSIVFQQEDDTTRTDVWMLPAGASAPRPILKSPFIERHGRLSPDGRYLAYSSDASQRFEVYVVALDDTQTTWQVSSRGGALPRWRRDGRELFYLDAIGRLTAVPVTTSPSFSAGPPRPLFDAHPPLPLAFSDFLYDVTADGQRFLVASREGRTAQSFTVVLNWRAQITR